MTSVFFVLTTPFHSPLSNFIIFTFPNRVIRVHAFYFTIVLCIFALLAVLTFRLTFNEKILLIYLIFASSCISVSRLRLGQVRAQNQPNPRLVSLASFVYFFSGIIVIVFIALSCARTPFTIMYHISYYVTGIALVALTAIRLMLQRTPDEDQGKAEAVAWMLKTQPSPDLTIFREAFEIATNSPHLRPILLDEILPVLDLRINGIRGDGEQDLRDEEKSCISLLAVLVDFEPRKAVLWRNEAALEQPVLSDELKGKLHILRQGGSAPIRAYAEFILGKTSRKDVENIA